MNPETHEAALLAAYKQLPYRPGLHDIEPLIATYLREAGLVVRPADPTKQMCIAGDHAAFDLGIDFFSEEKAEIVYRAMLAAFNSPFGEE